MEMREGEFRELLVGGGGTARRPLESFAAKMVKCFSFFKKKKSISLLSDFFFFYVFVKRGHNEVLILSSREDF